MTYCRAGVSGYIAAAQQYYVLRDHDDGEGIHPHFAQPCQYGMTKRVQDKIARADGGRFPFHYLWRYAL